MALHKKGGGGGEVEENVFWTTMSDLLLGLMVVFMTLFILAMTGFTTQKLEEKQQQASMAEEINQELMSEDIKKLLAEIDPEKIKEQLSGMENKELGELLAKSNVDIEKLLEGMGKKENVANLSDKQIKELLDKLGQEDFEALMKALSGKDKQDIAKNLGDLDKEFQDKMEKIEKTGVDLALKSANKGAVIEEVAGLSKEELGKLLAAAKGAGQGEKQNLANLSDKEIKELLDKLGEEEFAKLMKALSGEDKKDIAKNLGDKDKNFQAKLQTIENTGVDKALKAAKRSDLAEEIASLSDDALKKALAAIAKGEMDKNFLGNLTQEQIKEIIDKLGKDEFSRLLANMSVNSQDKLAKKLGEEDAEIQKKLNEIKNKNLQVEGLNGLVKISDLELFELNSYVLSAKGRKTLDKFFPIYINTVFSKPEIVAKMSAIVIQGHTDSQSFKGVSSPEMQFAKNMELSLKRANTVAEYMFKTKYNKKYTPLLIKYVQVEGKSFTEPILVNGKEDYAKSRRVELKINSKQTDFGAFMINNTK